MCDENKELQQENRIFLLIATPAWKLYSFGVIQAKHFFFFLSGFAFTDTDDSLESRVREGIMFYFSLLPPPDLKHSDIYF